MPLNFQPAKFQTNFLRENTFILRKFHFAKKSSSLMKIERNQGCFFKKSDFILRKARLEISKSRIEKIKSRFFLEKINEKIEKNSEKIAKNKDFSGRKSGLKKLNA